ncbi:MAG: hypothetical protein KGI33_11920 [Thaumarchaeota archaeon]|nr:hypothetical protein [Nitrososphaerota archaeon]
MSLRRRSRALRLTLLFTISYLVPYLINQVVLGQNAAVTLVLNIYLAAVLSLLTLVAWRKYNRILKNIPGDKIYFITEPNTLFTVLALFSFTIILSAINVYESLGLFNIIAILFLGPLLMAIVSGNIPFTFRNKRSGWRDRR